MALNKILSNPALKDHNKMELNEEWNNFMKRIGDVSNLVRDMASGDKEKADAAQVLADKYLQGKVILDEEVTMNIKDDRTVINKKTRKTCDDSGEIDKETWMAEVSKDAERRALDRKIRREKADTFKTQAVKAFRRGEYERALSCYDRAIEQIKDNPMFYCDRALTNIKLGYFEKVVGDCDSALRLNEDSYKARLYLTKAYKELEEHDKYETSFNDLENKFPQHRDLTEYFLNKRENFEEDDDD
ncbi:RNA polymerase II-associated protein 3-like isoform X1 [Bombyx mandarina]|uniref:RNA polymerase II-associated protein 3-like isoform X1 n=1 Tax=Bombyx mandarina TaxID=7092 RepID=A0A6J2JKD7_BOMMA|nr:RNA polymerase II-associated protein 3-like isoform X1 [Bombyx mandarina]